MKAASEARGGLNLSKAGRSSATASEQIVQSPQLFMTSLLTGLQLFQVLFLGLHDWIPLGRLNDTKAARQANPGAALLTTTAISAAPFAILLAFSLVDAPRAYPGWLIDALLIAYGVLFLGELQAWWIPYLVWPQPRRALRYEALFGRTHAFLPERNGIRPNTLHILLHVSTLATLILLGVLSARS